MENGYEKGCTRGDPKFNPLNFSGHLLARNPVGSSPRGLSPEIAVETTLLAGFHNHPADQNIVATSGVLGMPTLTSDRRIRDFAEAESVW